MKTGSPIWVYQTSEAIQLKEENPNHDEQGRFSSGGGTSSGRNTSHHEKLRRLGALTVGGAEDIDGHSVERTGEQRYTVRRKEKVVFQHHDPEEVLKFIGNQK